ncbi:immunity protein YezG family protein [Macrococcus capreoli]|uniref:immunity protein YezG family protein n=1 Tax=Macrococcus capreoli TaxID=2982690 RepID=UPI003EE42422
MKQLINSKIIEIVEKANEMIPEEWYELYINGDINNGAGGIFFYYNTEQNIKNWQYSEVIPFEFEGIDEAEYDKEWMKLFKLCVALQEIFKENNQPIWSDVIIHVDENMKLTTEFDYADWDYSRYNEYQKMDFFRHEYLKLPLEDIDEAFFEEMKAFKQQENSKHSE